MAMATPASLPSTSASPSPSRTNGSYGNGNGKSHSNSSGHHNTTDPDRSPLSTLDASSSSTATAQHRQHQFVQQRTLKSSKSVDGLMGRARSHTADPTIHNLRGNFQHMHINSPNLTQTQIDTYGVPDERQQRVAVPLRRGVSVSHNGNEHSPSSSSSREEITHVPRRPSQRQQQSQSRERSSSRHRDQQSKSPTQPTSSSSTSQSPYQNLHVQSSQIASRSTPKLSLYPQQQMPPSQRDFTNESKETRSFNGLPGQLESAKPKPKTSKLKPIVTPENTNDDHVER